MKTQNSVFDMVLNQAMEELAYESSSKRNDWIANTIKSHSRDLGSESVFGPMTLFQRDPKS